MTGLDCPACRKPLREVSHRGVLIDTCTQYRGVWLDRGELEKIAASLDGDDHRERGPDGRPRGSRLSRPMDFFG